jgi:hypothetical protein
MTGLGVCKELNGRFSKRVEVDESINQSLRVFRYEKIAAFIGVRRVSRHSTSESALQV